MNRPTDYHAHIDPEYRRWGAMYPRFPGVAECVDLLRRRNVKGAWIDIIAHELTVHAGECLPELIAVFRTEDNDWVRLMVLMSIEDARLPEAIPFLTEVIREGEPRFVPHAERGLSALGTKEARAALWGVSNAKPNRGDENAG